MLKKIAAAMFVSAITLALAAPMAAACPGMEKDKSAETDQDKGVVAKNESEKSTEKAPAKTRKDSKKKVAKADKAKKKPIN